MLNKVVVILACLAGALASADERVSVPEVEKLLGSDDFKVRQDTMEKLWKEGKITIEMLDGLVDSKDPEIRVRATSLRRKLLLGLSPDTPDEILKLLDDYFSQSPNGKVLLFNKLKNMSEFGLMLRLKSIETDEDVLGRLNEIVTEILPNVQAGLLVEGELREARELLLLNDDYQSLIAYANLCDHLGELDREIGRLRALDDEKSRARYLACLRVKGDATILRAEAERLGDRQAAMVAAFAQGDVKPLFGYLEKEGDLSRMDRSYLSWVLAEWDGDLDLMEKYHSRLRHHIQDSPEAFQANRNLLKMGKWEEVLEGYPKELMDQSRFYFLLGQDRNIEALKLLGLDGPELTDEWMNGVYKRTVRRFRDQDEESPDTELFMAARFFENRGMVQEAARCFEKFFDAVRVVEDEDVLSWIPDVFQTAPGGALIAFAREVEKFEMEIGSVISAIFRDDDRLEWIKVRLLDEAKKKSSLEVLQLMASFYGEPFVAVELFEEVEKKFRDEALEGNEPEVGLKYLLEFAQIREQKSDILLYLRLLKEKEKGIPNLETWYLGMLEEYAKAAEIYENSGILETATSPSYLYRAGMVLGKADVPDGETHLKKAMLFSQGRGEMLTKFAEIQLSMGEVDKARELYDAALLRMERLDVSEPLDLEEIMEGGATCALLMRDWRRALAFFELETWLLKNPLSSSQVLRLRHNVLLARGMVAMEEGRREDAVRDLREAHGLIPSDGVLADEFFPALREAGLTELHDELFEKSAELVRENIRFFPMDHNMKNTFGWLASRANRALDEAEGYLREAVKVRPLSAAYLDTMAEIQFARGNREKAVEWSNRSLDQMLGDVQLRQQNRRFRHGPFPLK